MNVLSYYDGISCGQIALNKSGIKYSNYFAAEINKYAIKVTNHNFKKTIQLGDVTKINVEELPKIDLFIGGSPCQGFSLAGKQLNFEDERSKLFFEYVKSLNKLRDKNPDLKFLLENVNMKSEFKNIITDFIGVEPILVNSSLVSAQFRDRLYWSNIEFSPPEPKNIILKNIIDRNLSFTHKCQNIKLQKSSNGIENIKKGTSGFSWFYEQQTYSQNSLARTLKAGGGSGNIPKILNDDLTMFRKLTPQECKKMQTIPDCYDLSEVSNSQQYIQIGNGWTIDIIECFFKNLKTD